MKSGEKGINTFQRYLSVWVLLCMAVGVSIGHFIPVVPAVLDKLQVSGISIPIAVLIWVMIYPMMMKVDFQSVRQIGKNPKGLFVTWIVNWLIKPFTMYGIAWLFIFVIFRLLFHLSLRPSTSPEQCFWGQPHVRRWSLSGAPLQKGILLIPWYR